MARILTIALLALLALPGTAFALEQKLLAGDGAQSDTLGSAVALEGDTAVVGASRDNDGRGAVYVFTRVGNLWRQTAKLTASDGAVDDELGRAVAIDGDTIVAGAPYDNASQGSAYTFTRTGAATRTQTAKLTSATSIGGANLGLSVAIDGDTIVAGAPRDKVGANETQGSVHTFARVGPTARTETARLTASDGAPSDLLGACVAIDGDTIVAGAPADSVANAGEGSAYTFASTGDSARTQTAKLTAADNTGFAGDGLGTSVAIDGDTIAAGAAFDNLGANEDQGSVLTFDRAGAATRSQTARLRASDGAEDDHLGFSVAIDGDAIIAGAPQDITGGEGAVYTFTRGGDASRTEITQMTAATVAAGDLLGITAAIDGETILAGAPRDGIDGKASQGSASVFFQEAPSEPPAEQPPVEQPFTSADRTGPSLTRARLSRRRFRVGRSTILSFRLSEVARISVRIERRLRNRRGRRRYKRAGTFTRRARAGANRIRFSGRIGRRKLKPGSYRLTLTPTDAAGNRGKPRRLSFRIVR